jgi:hypothetical protein
MGMLESSYIVWSRNCSYIALLCFLLSIEPCADLLSFALSSSKWNTVLAMPQQRLARPDEAQLNVRLSIPPPNWYLPHITNPWNRSSSSAPPRRSQCSNILSRSRNCIIWWWPWAGRTTFEYEIYQFTKLSDVIIAKGPAFPEWYKKWLDCWSRAWYPATPPNNFFQVRLDLACPIRIR